MTKATHSSHKIKFNFCLYFYFNLLHKAKCAAAPGEAGKWIDVPECLRVCPSIEIPNDYNVKYSQTFFFTGTILTATCKNDPQVTGEER